MSDARLSPFEKIGYALGDAGLNLYWRVFDVFLMVFYTDVFGISPTAAGTMLLVARVWDGINDPLMGILADRTRTRFGSYRPWLVWAALPMALAGVLAFTVPDWSATPKLVYAYVTYIFMMTAYTAIGIPYSALMGVISTSTRERTSIASYRFVGAFTGGLAVSFGAPWLVSLLGGGDDAAGWSYTMMVFGVVAIVLFGLCFASTKERVAPEARSWSELGQDLASQARNRPLLILFGLTAILFFALAMRGATGLYYLQYYVDPSGFSVLGLDLSSREAFVSTFLTTSGFAFLAGVLLTDPLSRLASKHVLYVILSIATNALAFALFFVPADQVWLIVGISLLSGFVAGPLPPLMFAMLCDVADYGAFTTGRRATGLVFAGSLFFGKIGAAAGGYTTGVLLDAYGYVANQPQTPTALTGILLLAHVIPGVVTYVAIGLIAFYGLSDRKMAEVEAGLAARRAG